MAIWVLFGRVSGIFLLALVWRIALLVGLAAFLAIFLPWGIAAYIQTIIAPTFAALWVNLATQLFGKRSGWIYLLGILALAVGGYRAYTMISRLGDIRSMVEAAPDWERNGIREIGMPCFEGRDAMMRYLHEGAHVQIEVSFVQDLTPAAMDGKFLLFDQALCPLPGRASTIAGCSSEDVFTGSFGASYKLARMRCR